ncbi:bifunctional 3'-5' exonuclease/DNA polymerase [Asanoa sp. WMMD1127]|uniref:bifunctional 3'-5' exonuclease/DNA polymerase n=1 Tax=Asanoa sp. WMMD1127 TaxID=3016107 RepID=UPI002415FF8B|nr:bifunctional 3'-5' exonuclease/DNA polymerase [Asanoa sp. WMMD1127]MDG4826706.1 bifunctional 3'-5' exonuclease/DNA polymerase [Asanoa sp. WMMD1127]
MVAAVPGEGGSGRLLPLDDGGRPAGPAATVPSLAAAVASVEAASRPRWVWPSTSALYPSLLAAGVRVERCHDVELTEALLLGSAGSWGSPRSVAAALARLRGGPVPPDPPPLAASPPGDGQAALFAAVPPAVSLDDLVTVHADQRARMAAVPSPPGRFRLLVAAESAGALVAAEMGAAGLPWRSDVHDALLRELLGAPSAVGGPPARLAALAAEIAAAFGVRSLHPESPGELLKAFHRAGVDVPNTRSWTLQRVDHPAVRPVLAYKELFRIWTAHGWAWRDAWVQDGRFRPEYVPGGVVSGRWASRGGGALQIPKVVRRAVVADPGWRLVVADAAQLEPRVLAAVSGDDRLAAAGQAGDLYAALAADAFGGDRARAKVALLGAMYGQTGGAAVPALAVLRSHYPTAFDYVESAARTGEGGGLVRSWLGRTCPPSSVSVSLAEAGYESGEVADTGRARARGRFTRNFVIQATAAEWALALLATLRTALAGTPAELVLFQHDEVLVHCPADQAESVVEAVHAAGARATATLFGDTEVRFPMEAVAVDCYAEAK